MTPASPAIRYSAGTAARPATLVEGQSACATRIWSALREGDTVYLIATELSIHNRGGWGAATATTNGSTNLIVWESHDFVNWSEPRSLTLPLADSGSRHGLGLQPTGMM